MKLRLRRADLWPCVILTLALWTALGVARWMVGPALPDVAVALLALVGFIPAYLGLLVSVMKWAARNSESTGYVVGSGGQDAIRSSWSRLGDQAAEVPVSAGGSTASETKPAVGGGTDKRPAEAGLGLWTPGARAAKTVKFSCSVCLTKREMDDFALVDERGKPICVGCQAREGGFYRPVPASLAQAVRAILDATADL